MIRVSLSLPQTAEDRDFDPWRSLDTPMPFRGYCLSCFRTVRVLPPETPAMVAGEIAASMQN
jgi:hypothetical protein